MARTASLPVPSGDRDARTALFARAGAGLEVEGAGREAPAKLPGNRARKPPAVGSDRRDVDRHRPGVGRNPAGHGRAHQEGHAGGERRPGAGVAGMRAGRERCRNPSPGAATRFSTKSDESAWPDAFVIRSSTE